MKLRYRVITGYGESDYIAIPEEFLEKATYAMISGKVFVYKNHLVRGSEIKQIEEDYRFYTGWNDGYKPRTQDDKNQISAECPVKKLEARAETANKRVELVLRNNQTELLNNPESIDQLLLK